MSGLSVAILKSWGFFSDCNLAIQNIFACYALETAGHETEIITVKFGHTERR